MDTNQKSDRYEDKLVRIGSKARSNLGLSNEKSVELWPSTSTKDRINRSRTLSIYKAFSADLKKSKEGMPAEQFNRIGFVTTNTFNYICGGGAEGYGDIWLSPNIDDTVIGGDPEFILLNADDSVKYAGAVNGFGSSGELASDGPLAELRPDPTITADDFVENIRSILKKHPNTSLISKYKWLASCCWGGSGKTPYNGDRQEWPVGGHIHIGTPLKIAEAFADSNYFKRGFYMSLCRILDELLAVPLMKLDGKDESIARRSHYGSFGSYRTDHDRLEYRTLSGIWIAHPMLALTVLGTAKAIIDSFFKMVESNNFDEKYVGRGETNMLDHNFKSWDKVGVTKDIGTTKSSSEMASILNNYEIKYNKSYITELTKKLRGLIAYDQYAGHIDTLIELVSMPYKDLNTINKNIKETWIEGEEFII